MGCVIMDGHALSERLRPQLKRHAEELARRHGCVPGLAAVLVGDQPASEQYVKNKRKAAAELGFLAEIHRVDRAEASTESLLRLMAQLNADPRIHGILLQLPLPPALDVYRLFDTIDPAKDIDGVGQASVTALYRGRSEGFLPCTPRGVAALLSYYRVPVEGARAVVIGRSDIAGKPLAFLLGGRMCNATVTWCHRHTRELKELCLGADIIAACAGADLGENFLITAEMVKPGACVIDVGFRRVAPGRFRGDVDFDRVKEVAGWLTPNPGGTGPMTVTALMQNLIDAARCRLGLGRASYPV